MRNWQLLILVVLVVFASAVVVNAGDIFAVVKADFADDAAVPVAQSAPVQPAPVFVPPDDWAGPAMGTGAAGEFAATGLCAPALVTTEMLRWALSPSVGDNPMTVDQTDTTLTLGDYTVNVDAASRSVTVTGPEGADVLSRDIDRCVVGEGTPGVPPATIGNWRYADGTGWRYVDEPNPVYSEEVQNP